MLREVVSETHCQMFAKIIYISSYLQAYFAVSETMGSIITVRLEATFCALVLRQ